MKTSERTYTTLEVARMLRVDYYTLDRAVRSGAVVIASDPMPGSGHHRAWTHDEVRRLRIVFAAKAAADDTLERYRSGELWAKTP